MEDGAGAEEVVVEAVVAGADCAGSGDAGPGWTGCPNAVFILLTKSSLVTPAAMYPLSSAPLDSGLVSEYVCDWREHWPRQLDTGELSLTSL